MKRCTRTMQPLVAPWPWLERSMGQQGGGSYGFLPIYSQCASSENPDPAVSKHLPVVDGYLVAFTVQPNIGTNLRDFRMFHTWEGKECHSLNNLSTTQLVAQVSTCPQRNIFQFIPTLNQNDPTSIYMQSLKVVLAIY